MSMGSSFQQFLKTGQLGPLALGMDPLQVETLLGEPEARSRKLRPLVLKYGPLELTFLSAKTERPQLAQLTLRIGADLDALPRQIAFDDWHPITAELTLNHFTEFLRGISVKPTDILTGEHASSISMPSGITASFTDGLLTRLHLSRREQDDNRAPVLTDEREPSLQDIHSILNDARRATQQGFTSAGLMLAWAALEASLRRAAVEAGLKGKIGVQPSALIRELYANGRLSKDNMTFLEEIRQRRTAIAHGLTSQPVDQEVVSTIINLADRFLRSASATTADFRDIGPIRTS